MYTRFQLSKKYLHYWLTASNGKGHGVHSPFVFDLIKNVLRDKKHYDHYQLIETRRQELLKRSTEIEVEDLGAGSVISKTKKRAVATIASSSLKPAKYAQLLYRMARYYNAQTILELGTSFGITTSYLATANARSKIYTIEGSAAIAEIAKDTFESLDLRNVKLIQGDFKDRLPDLLSKLNTIDLAFIDGNHRKEPTLDYFKQLLPHTTPTSILIFDDIHWSADMEAAWKEIKENPSVTLTIDLFFIGIVFFNPDISHKQDFSIRF